MKFQKKLEEYKQRQEAKKFFNQHNDYYLALTDYVKLLVTGIATATIVSLIFDVIGAQLKMSFLVFYLFIGYAVSYAVLKVAHLGSVKTGVICLISYLLGLWFSSAILLAYYYQSFGAKLSLLLCLKNGLLSLLNGNILTYLFIMAGAFIAYTVGKD